jgi:CRISPR system Cascade subunit CasB
MNTEVAIPTQTASLASTVARLAAVIGNSRFPAGDRAALRRWTLGQPVPLAFYRLWLRHAGEELPPEAQMENWMILVCCMTTLGEKSHTPTRRLGQALAESGFSEGRLERLLSAPDGVRSELLMNAVRLLAAKGDSFNLAEAAQFLLTKDEARREGVNRRIAEAFYRHLPKND